MYVFQRGNFNPVTQPNLFSSTKPLDDRLKRKIEVHRGLVEKYTRKHLQKICKHLNETQLPKERQHFRGEWEQILKNFEATLQWPKTAAIEKLLKMLEYESIKQRVDPRRRAKLENNLYMIEILKGAHKHLRDNDFEEYKNQFDAVLASRMAKKSIKERIEEIKIIARLELCE